MIPTYILRLWILGLLSLGIIAGAAYLGHEWYQRSWGYDPVRQQSFFNPQFGANEPTLLFAIALLLLLVAIAGKMLVRALLSLTRGARKGKPAGSGTGDSPYSAQQTPSEQQRIRRPDGSELQVEFYGPKDAHPIIVSHGWGMNSDEWNYLKHDLTDRFRVVTWDEPGLGHSTRPANRDYSLENLARDLEAVLSLVDNRPAILLGHSIGGMITLTFCSIFPDSLGSRVAGLVLTNTTYTNPVRTTKGARFYTAIERPVLVPLLYAAVALSPLVWLMNWLSYQNGSAHLSTKRSSFGGTETWEQIDFAARFQVKASPAVLARGMMGMLHYDASDVLGRIGIPTLVVTGDQDTTCKPEASKHIHKAISGSRLISLTPARHLSLIEHHSQYAKAVREFAIPAFKADT